MRAGLRAFDEPEAVFELANPEFCKMLERHAVVGKSVRDASPELPADAPNFQMVDGVYRSGEPFVAHEFESAPLDRRGDGSRDGAFFRLGIAPTRGDGGGVES